MFAASKGGWAGGNKKLHALGSAMSLANSWKSFNPSGFLNILFSIIESSCSRGSHHQLLPYWSDPNKAGYPPQESFGPSGETWLDLTLQVAAKNRCSPSWKASLLKRIFVYTDENYISLQPMGPAHEAEDTARQLQG